ncbi:hypothetical protein ACIHCQ_29805 [Streptomyces sp. NPDC052236]|uniref:hypothetical protein n=1 Tax=Streptomyces sp. NPDC052236 TaxID=3365686 RepID=UPI0037CF3582
MAIGTAGSGGSAVRWAYGALLALCVALAVFVHHGTAAAGLPSRVSAAHASAMPAMPAMPAGHSGHAMPLEQPLSIAGSSAHGLGAGACSAPGMQHCAPTSAETVQLPLPLLGWVEQFPSLYEASTGLVPARAIGRAPPDLSVLSQLRI